MDEIITCCFQMAITDPSSSKAIAVDGIGLIFFYVSAGRTDS
jgi:hypothetical protein